MKCCLSELNFNTCSSTVQDQQLISELETDKGMSPFEYTWLWHWLQLQNNGRKMVKRKKCCKGKWNTRMKHEWFLIACHCKWGSNHELERSSFRKPSPLDLHSRSEAHWTLNHRLSNISNHQSPSLPTRLHLHSSCPNASNSNLSWQPGTKTPRGLN